MKKSRLLSLVLVGMLLALTAVAAYADSTYIVQPGDSLAAIARRFGVTIAALVEANDIPNPDLIRSGRQLIIPDGGTPALVPAAPTPAGTNLLPNGSFENGWYNANGVQELQLPNSWIFEWDEGSTGFGNQPWDVWVRPETRVLPETSLPTSERATLLWDGAYTIKIFKGQGAISYRLFTDVALQPGTYLFTVNFLPDMVVRVESGRKIWADSSAGEMHIIQGSGGTGWQSATIGQRNTVSHTFTITQPQTVRLGFAARGHLAINSNGWFLDDWSLVKTN